MAEYIFEKISKNSDGVDSYINHGELVRCKDCKHHDGKDGQCPVQSTGDPIYDYKPTDNWYCGDGERSEDETTNT